jgi:hypothetical protein
MGTGDIESDLIAAQHPETTEDSIVKLLGKKLNKAENDFTCVKLVPKNIPTLTFISFKVEMSEELFQKSIDPTVWPNGEAIREFVNRSRKFFSIKRGADSSLNQGERDDYVWEDDFNMSINRLSIHPRIKF